MAIPVPNLTQEVSPGSGRSLSGEQTSFKTQQFMSAASSAIQSLQPATRYVSANYPATSTDKTIVGIGIATITVYLPAANKNPNWVYTIKTHINSATLGVQVAPAGSDTIDLVSGVYGPLVLSTYYQSITIQSDGISNWTIIGAVH